MRLGIKIGWVAALIGSSILTTARADILTLTSGREIKGIIEDAKPDSTHVKFIGADFTQSIPRSRIQSIKKEPLALGHLHIGDDYRDRDKLELALVSYRKALDEDPELNEAKERIEAVSAMLGARKKARRDDDIDQINRMMDEVRDLTREQDFQQAESLLKASDSLKPSEEQKVKLQKLIGNLYLAWAKERYDKFDKSTAEEKLNLALVSIPENDEVIEMLLKLWEGQADKKEQSLRVYETVLDRRPEDSVLRYKVAELYYELEQYDQAIIHYLRIYKNNEERLADTPMEARIIQNLTYLHQNAAKKRDWDQAIYYNDVLTEVDPNVNPFIADQYAYYKYASEHPPKDSELRVALAKFAEGRGLNQYALDHYREVLKEDPENEEALAAIERHAGFDVEEARLNFNQGFYSMTVTLAMKVEHDYPQAREALLMVRDLMGRANQEIQRNRKEDRERAKDYVTSGDKFYDRAEVYWRDIFDSTRGRSVMLGTPKADAIRNYQYAIRAYESALKIDPSLKNDPGLGIGDNLAEAKNRLARLLRRPRQFGFNQRLRPNI